MTTTLEHADTPAINTQEPAASAALIGPVEVGEVRG